MLDQSFVPFDDSGIMESKRQHNFYQEQVMCPGGETSLFRMGLDSWKSPSEIIDKIRVMPDLELSELAGFLLPAVGIGFLGYLYLNGRVFK